MMVVVPRRLDLYSTVREGQVHTYTCMWTEKKLGALTTFTYMDQVRVRGHHTVMLQGIWYLVTCTYNMYIYTMANIVNMHS